MTKTKIHITVKNLFYLIIKNSVFKNLFKTDQKTVLIQPVLKQHLFFLNPSFKLDKIEVKMKQRTQKHAADNLFFPIKP